MTMSVSAPPAPAPVSAGRFHRYSVHSDARHLLGLEGMTRDVLLALLEDAALEREWLRSGAPNRADLAGCSVMLAFVEDSTRTRMSFEVAARRLGANALTFNAGASSLNKGETLLDTMKVFEAMERSCA